MFDYEVGQVVHYASRIDGTVNKTGLIVQIEYQVKADDFLVYIMWDDTSRPQALYQHDCHERNLRMLN